LVRNTPVSRALPSVLKTAVSVPLSVFDASLVS
jgi:hypothetical protein